MTESLHGPRQLCSEPCPAVSCSRKAQGGAGLARGERAGGWSPGLPLAVAEAAGRRGRGGGDRGVGLSSTGRTLGLGPVRTVARSQGRRGGSEARLGVTGTQSAFRAITMPGPSAQQCGGQEPVARPKWHLHGDKDTSITQKWAEEMERDFVSQANSSH